MPCRLKRTASRPLVALAEDFADNDYLAVAFGDNILSMILLKTFLNAYKKNAA